jgi:hypothetical protein
MWTSENLRRSLSEVVDDRRRRRLLPFVGHVLEVDGTAVRERVEAVERSRVALLVTESEVDPGRKMTRDVVRLERLSMTVDKQHRVAVCPRRESDIVNRVPRHLLSAKVMAVLLRQYEQSFGRTQEWTHNVQQECCRVVKLWNQLPDVATIVRRSRIPCTGDAREQSVCKVKIAALTGTSADVTWRLRSTNSPAARGRSR